MLGRTAITNPLAADGFIHRIKIALALAFLAMGVFSVAAYATIDQLITYGNQVSEARRDQVAIEQVRSSLSAARTSLREYLVTGRHIDLDRYHEHREAFRQALVDLRVARLPEQLELETVTERAILAVETAKRIRDTDGVEAAFVAVRTGALKADTAKLVQLLQNAVDREQRRWFEINKVAPAAWAKGLITAAVVFLGALLAWGVFVARQYGRYATEAKARLEYAELLGRTVTANMADGMLIVTPELLVSDVNEAALALLGLERRDVLGRSMYALLGGTQEALGLGAMIEEGLATREAFKLVGHPVTAAARNGATVQLRVSANDVRVQGERLVAVLLHDITEIVRAAAETEASKEQLREITDALPILIAEVDADWRFNFHNKTTSVYLGMPGEAIVGKRVSDVLDPEAYAFHRDNLEQVFQGKEARYERSKVFPDGTTRHFRMHLFPRFADSVRKDNVIGCYALGTDITDLKRIDKMKTEFISTVSHELRTPLTSIRGSLGLISGGVAGKLPDQLAKLVDIAKNNSERLIRLINDILDSEKIESGAIALKLHRHDLAQQVRQSLVAMEGFGRQHGVPAVLRQDLAYPAPVLVDSDRLAQVMMNLLSNAIKFSPKGAEVQVRLQLGQGAVRVEVSDRGPGIPVEFQPRLFEKFSQADASDTRAKGGTGLGLNITKSLVEMMGGRIWFTSAAGTGTTFYVEFPLAAGDAPPGAKAFAKDAEAGRDECHAEPPALDASTEGACLLHLEDDRDIRQIVAAAARDCFECVPASTLDEARASLEQRKFDLILLDLDLHGSSGWDLLDDLEKLDHKPPVVVFSASDEQPPSGKSVEAVLVKSRTTEEELVRAICALIPPRSTLFLCSEPAPRA